jgi:predicted PurR-regulated permease PerM
MHTGLLLFAYILGPVVFGISGVFLGAIALVLLINYLKVVLPPLLRKKLREESEERNRQAGR